MRDIIASGKASYWGFSNYYGWEIGEIIQAVRQDRHSASRNRAAAAHIVMRMAENDYLPACKY